MIARSPYPDVEIPEMSLPDFVLNDVRSLGRKPALVDGPSGRTLSYTRLARGVRRLASGFASRGFAKGDVLAIFSPNIPEYAVAAYAVQTLGGVIAPVHPLYREEELTRLLRLGGAKYLLTIPQLCDTALPAARAADVEEVFVFGRREGATPLARLLWARPRRLRVPVRPREDAAVIAFTSGTSGSAKGVVLTHYNLIANVCQVQATERDDGPAVESETVLGLLPFAHIFGLGLLNNVLYRGATMVTVPRYDLREFLSTLERYRVTYANLVPPLVQVLAEHPLVDEYDLSALAVIGSGAAALDEETALRCAERLECWVHQGYGMTELSPVSHVNNDPPREIDRASVGRCIPNTETKIVDPATGAELGFGATGEICVRGPQRMKGYLNDPEATAAAIDGDGWLRTGDLGRLGVDGALTLVGRIKEMIKVKGNQVAPVEIEAVLREHPRVLDAAVIGVPDREAGEIPKAFVVASGEVAADAIGRYVAERVAPFKRVRAVEFVASLPRLPTGKIDRRALRERASALRSGARVGRPSRP